MVRKLRYVSIAIVIALCATALLYGPAQAPAQAQRQPAKSEGDEPRLATIMVEAFVVEVNLPALDEVGVSPIGEPPHSVSVRNILGCIEKGQAHVIAGAKEAVQDQRENRVRVTRTRYARREGPSQRGYTPYQTGTTLEARIAMQSETSVEVRYSFSCTVFGSDNDDQDTPADTEAWDWQGSILLTPGEPVIAAADQNDQRAIFMLLIAHVRNQ